jgi:hypothetical protein
MGQPAACMMDSKKTPSSFSITNVLDYRPRAGHFQNSKSGEGTAISVDNFVENLVFVAISHTQVSMNFLFLYRLFLNNQQNQQLVRHLMCCAAHIRVKPSRTRIVEY